MSAKKHPILLKVETALIEHDVSQTRFGYSAAGDPTLVAKLRKGRMPRASTIEKIKKALQKLEDGESL